MIMTNAVMENILTRRTIRRFLTKQILEEELQTVLEAGLYAPSAAVENMLLVAIIRG